MKHATVLAVAAVLVLIAVLWVGGRLLTDRHTVSRYTFTLPTNVPAAISGEVVLTGIHLALQDAGMKPVVWHVSPSSQWQPKDNLRLGVGTSVALQLIVLSNSDDGTLLYARVARAAETNSLEYHLYHPK